MYKTRELPSVDADEEAAAEADMDDGTLAGGLPESRVASDLRSAAAGFLAAACFLAGEVAL